MTASRFACSVHAFTVGGVGLEVAAIGRQGSGAPILFLHGFGSTKEDYADITLQPVFDDMPFLAYDAPGCGETACHDLSRVSIPLLIETALVMLERAGYDRFHLVGHSMGGLTALMLADRVPQRVLSFTNIEGNVAPEDCFLSRQIHEHSREDDDLFFADFVERTRLSPAPASALYAASLTHKVRAGAVRGIFTSMVDLSDNGGLLERFECLPCRKTFMFGDANASLSYLPRLAASGVRLASIPACGHFPMYSNPPAMWSEIAATVLA